MVFLFIGYFNNGYTLSREESSYSEDNIAVPSTSTGKLIKNYQFD